MRRNRQKKNRQKYRRNSFAMPAENSIITVAVKNEAVTEKKKVTEAAACGYLLCYRKKDRYDGI